VLAIKNGNESLFGGATYLWAPPSSFDGGGNGVESFLFPFPERVISTFNREKLAEVHVPRKKIEYNDMPPAFSMCEFF